MNYTETVEYLYACLPMFQKVGSAAFKKDLGNTLLLLKALDNPQDKIRTVHIAGTNGKGSTAHTLAAILQSAGYKTGLYTSPHLKNFTERIRIDGKEIGEDAVVSFVEKIRPTIEIVKPSFFEVTVAMAFDAFHKAAVDIAIIETGLGGRLDSTNVIQPELSIITNIGFDHQAILGNTLSAIAAEKAGIIKAGTPVVIGEYQEATIKVFQDKAQFEKAPLFIADKEYLLKGTATDEGYVVDVYWKDKLYLKGLQLSLAGIYQLKNVPGILKAVAILEQKGYNIAENALRTGFKNVAALSGLKGRWQILQRHPLVVCDTGHNEAGIKYIVQQLSALSYKKLYVVIGVANDKSLDSMLSVLPKEAFYYFCEAKVPRALAATVLAEQANKFGLKGKVVLDINTAIEEAKARATVEDVVFIGGSSFVVAEIDDL